MVHFQKSCSFVGRFYPKLLCNNDKLLLAFNFLLEEKIGYLRSCKLEHCLQSKCLSVVMLRSVVDGFMAGVREARTCGVLSEKLYKNLY